MIKMFRQTSEKFFSFGRGVFVLPGARVKRGTVGVHGFSGKRAVSGSGWYQEVIGRIVRRMWGFVKGKNLRISRVNSLMPLHLCRECYS